MSARKKQLKRTDHEGQGDFEKSWEENSNGGGRDDSGVCINRSMCACACMEVCRGDVLLEVVEKVASSLHAGAHGQEQDGQHQSVGNNDKAAVCHLVGLKLVHHRNVLDTRMATVVNHVVDIIVRVEDGCTRDRTDATRRQMEYGNGGNGKIEVRTA